MNPDHRPRRHRPPSRVREDPRLRRLLVRYRDERRRQRAFQGNDDPYGIYIVAAEVCSRRVEALRYEILTHLAGSGSDRETEHVGATTSTERRAASME